MTPLELPAFMAGTVAGMTVWGVVYASLGGASRSLLKSGVDPEQLFGGQCFFALLSADLHCIPQGQQTHTLTVCLHSLQASLTMLHCTAILLCVILGCMSSSDSICSSAFST